MMVKTPAQDETLPSKALSRGKRTSRKDFTDEEYALWEGTKPSSITEWRNRRRYVDRVHGYMVSQNMEALIENSYYERYEIFQLWARFKCLCTLSSTAHGIDRSTFMDFL